jgi:hypothetical protein
MREEMPTKKPMNVKILAIAVGVYIVAAIVSFLVFNNLSGGTAITPVAQPKKTANGKLLFDPELPKTESCPINGAMYSKQQKAWWEKHAPLGVMIENHLEARPQSGLSSADIVYEAVAEGGITRFLAIFYCQDAEFIGPVRSARTYFVDMVSEYGPSPLYAHVGGANTPGPANALGQISDYGWAGVNDLNQFSIGFPVYVRDYDRLGRTVATEHTVYSSTTKLWDYASKSRKLTSKNTEGEEWNTDYISYKFKADAASSARPKSQSVGFNFWNGYGDYAVSYTYDPVSNTYKRTNGGTAHKDLNTKAQLSPKNVVVLYMKESRANDGYEGNLHMIYGTKGTGNATVFRDGEEIDATWSKKNRTSHLFIKDKRGQDIEFNKGQIWFEIVAPDTEITVK